MIQLVQKIPCGVAVRLSEGSVAPARPSASRLLPEYDAMLTALPDEIKPLLVLAYYTGCRRGEILSLQWSQVDLLERVIRLEPGATKNKEARTIPLAQDVVEVLAMQRHRRNQYHPRCPWVFFRHATGDRLEDFRGAWAAACKTGRVVRCGHEASHPPSP
jgi:integrase